MATFLPATSPPALRDFAALMAGNVAERERKRVQEERDRAYSLNLIQSALSEREAARQDVAQQFGMERAASTDELARQQAARTYGINMLNARANLMQTGVQGRQIQGVEEQRAIENRRLAALDRLTRAKTEEDVRRQRGEDVFSRYKFGVEKTQTEAQEKRLAGQTEAAQKIARDELTIMQAAEKRMREAFEIGKPVTELEARLATIGGKREVGEKAFVENAPMVLGPLEEDLRQAAQKGPDHLERRLAANVVAVRKDPYASQYADLAEKRLQNTVASLKGSIRANAHGYLEYVIGKPTPTAQEWNEAAKYALWVDEKDGYAAAVKQKATNIWIAGDEATRAVIPESLVDQTIARQIEQAAINARAGQGRLDMVASRIAAMDRKTTIDQLIKVNKNMESIDFLSLPPEQQRPTIAVANMLRAHLTEARDNLFRSPTGEQTNPGGKSDATKMQELMTGNFE